MKQLRYSSVSLFVLFAGFLMMLPSPGVNAIDSMTPTPDLLQIQLVTSFETRDQRIRHGGNFIAWSPDGQLLLTGYRGGGEMQLWDAVTTELLTRLTSEQAVEAVSWSPDSRLIASAGFGPELIVWEITRDQNELKIEIASEHYSESQNASDVDFAPDGSRLAATSCLGRCGPAQVRDTASGDLLQEFQRYDPDSPLPHALGSAGLVRWNPTGTMLATSISVDYWMGAIIWDSATGQDVFRLRGYVTHPTDAQVAQGAADSLAWSPDGTRFAMSSFDQTRVWLLDLRADQATATLENTVPGASVVFLNDTHFVTLYGYFIRIWNINGTLAASTDAGTYTFIKSITLNPDRTQVAGIDNFGVVYIWDISALQS